VTVPYGGEAAKTKHESRVPSTRIVAPCDTVGAVGRPTDAATKRARTRRRNARCAATRATLQLVVALVGGLLAGGLVITAALPGTTGPIPATATTAAAVAVAVVTVLVARRLRPIDQGRSRR
jgi:lysozyme family protein